MSRLTAPTGRKVWKNGDYLFDGFAHRGYQEELDGWRNEIPDPSEFTCLRNANDVLDLYEALCEARREVWHLRKLVEMYEPVVFDAVKS